MEQKIDQNLPCVIESKSYLEAIADEFDLTQEDIDKGFRSDTGYVKTHNGINIYVSKPVNVNIS